MQQLTLGGARAALAICLGLATACSGITRNPLPEAGYEQATVLGRDDLRYWGDRADEHLLERMVTRTDLEQNYAGVMNTEHNYLVISGGGANGAYGAGVLYAWSELETRPEFTVVTGISTGALTAPFAFLGPEYDARLKEVYTTLDTRSIANLRSVFSLLGSDAVLDTTPLKRVIEQYIDDELIAALAREFRRGRRLQIGTTHLDAGRPVVWDITRIAASGEPGSGELIRDILRASAALPGAFPPVYIEVEGADGKRYDEMHVDGGVTSQMFFYPANVDWDQVEQTLGVVGRPTVHIIRNSRVLSDYQQVGPRLIPISGRTIATLIRTQGIGDFYRILSLAERDDIDVQVTWIPLDAVADVPETEAFDPRYMSALFDYAYRRTLAGETWSDTRILRAESLDPAPTEP